MTDNGTTYVEELSFFYDKSIVNKIVYKNRFKKNSYHTCMKMCWRFVINNNNKN